MAHTRYRLIAAALALLTAVPAAADTLERYVTVSRPDGDDSRKEVDHVTIKTTETYTVYRFSTDVGTANRRGWVRVDTDGAFIAALRIRTGEDDSGVDSLWVADGRLFAARRHDGETRVKDYELPDDKPSSVGASLLLWMRHFPFGSGRELRVFMVDYSQRKVDVVVREKGIETVEVTAGTFECHRMEVEVQVPIFNPRITFWLTTEAPHFLVRHEGKRGPFTPTYETELVEILAPE